jgi:hypothetical protein
VIGRAAILATLAVGTLTGCVPCTGGSRYSQLRCTVDRNTGFAHMTRGTNQHTIEALQHRVSDADIPVLMSMLDDRDHVVQLTAASVLARLVPSGRAALEMELARLQGAATLDFSKVNAIQNALKFTSPVTVP